MTQEKYETKFPVTFEGEVSNGWTNGVKNWHIRNATPGLFTLDLEHIANDLVELHNDPGNEESVESMYYGKVCAHKCKSCFNEERGVYSKEIYDLDKKAVLDDEGNAKLNRLMTLEDTVNVVDQAIEIAAEEGHDFKSVKFLGPGELLMNPQLFDIIDAYKARGVQLNIFTKGALLGSDELAQKYQGMNAKELTDRLASCDNVGLLMSFQSFDGERQNDLVTSKDENGETVGLQGYSQIREQTLENMFGSELYKNGMTNRVCMINAPIVPENVDESFYIYKFFIERGTPIVMTPSMVSGKGCGQYERQKEIMTMEDWHEKLVGLYAKIYAFNVEKGIQTDEQIKEEGVASYVGAEPCNQASTGLYIRGNGIVQSCPGRFDSETVYANVQETSLKDIWMNSSNKQRGIDDPQNLINNKCPAKDENGSTVKFEGCGFPQDFYDRVMKKYSDLMGGSENE